MADKYIDPDYVGSSIGYGYVTAARQFVDLDVLCEQATALIQSYLRNNGYATPSTTTDVTVKLAVLGSVWQQLASVPECNVALPEDWKEHPARIAYAGILSGDATVTHTLTTISAVGGSKFSAQTSADTNYRPARASRENLTGY